MRQSWLAACLFVMSSLILVPAVLAAEEKKEEAAAVPQADLQPAKDGKDAKKSQKNKARKDEQPAANKNNKDNADAPKATKPEVKPEGNPEAKPEEKKDAKKEPAKKKPVVVRFTLSGDYAEGPSAPGVFGDLQPSLASVIEKFDDAAGDKSVSAVWLRIENLALGRGKVAEVRAAIGRVRKAGKPVYAELSSGDGAQYLLASACDKVIMPPCGMLIVPGVRAEVTFYKGLLDKLGLQFDMLQMGKYKGAAEPMTRTTMSEPLRESMKALVDDTYDDLVATIAADRKLKPFEVKGFVNEGLFTAAAAQKNGLIDAVMYTDELEDSLRKELKADEIDLVLNYKKKQVDTDFSGIGGMMKLMELMMGGKSAEKSGKQKKIAVIYAVGPIVDGKSASDMFGDSSVGSNTMVAAIKKAAEDPKVLAIVLRIDSPGGSAVASDLIWRQTQKAGKPVIASMGDVAGSGGYYIAMGANKILAEPGTITGSIGVIGGKMVVGGLYDKVGLSTEVISRGEKSGALSSLATFTAEEREAWTKLLRETYRQFVDKAAEGRKMPREKLEALAQGRVYTGRMAVENGLVDKLGTLQDAIGEAKTAAGLKADDEVEIMVLPKPRTIFEQLFGDASISGDVESIMPGLMKTIRQARVWQKLLTSEPALMWMPYGVELR